MFETHMNNCASKALRVLGFVLRFSSDFDITFIAETSFRIILGGVEPFLL